MVGDVAKAKMTALEHCRSNPVKPQNIPDLLKGLPHWVVWKVFTEKSDGRFDKVPICPSSGYKVSAIDQTNHMTFEEALEAHQDGSGDGIGIVLTRKAVTLNDAGEPLYLIGVDLDKVEGCAEKAQEARKIGKSIGSYLEVSPSGTGIRIFALSKELVGRGQSPSGEMYNAGRFLTVTGHGRAREVVAATDQLKALEQEWWPDDVERRVKPVLSRISQASYPDTPRRRAELAEILQYISADCDYERYRDVVWAILSTKWHDAEDIACNWCLAAPERFDQDNFESVVNSYKSQHDNPVTIGSLIYWARKAGRHG